MSTFSVEVVKFTLEKHPNADSLSIARIRGWQAIVRTEDFINDTLGVYLPLDSITSSEHPLLSFLGGKKVKTIKLRQIISQGVLLPLSKVKEYLGVKGIDIELVEGTDLQSELEIKKWEMPRSRLPNLFGNTNPRKNIVLPDIMYKYTDIENIKNFPNVFNNQAIVNITEKLHGCLHSKVKVSLVDGDKVSIKDLVESNYRGEVLGVDKSGNIVPTKVINTFDNGITNNWMKIKIQNVSAGRGNSFIYVTCTDNHKFFIREKNDYIQAKDIKPNDTILSHRKDMGLRSTQEQILMGKMLGDGYLRIHGKSTASISFAHKKNHVSYIDWFMGHLGDLANPTRDEKISGYGTHMIRASTLSNFFIFQKFNSWVNNNKRIFPKEEIKNIMPLALACWYMDDGSLSHNEGQEDRANFAVCRYDEDSVNNILQALYKFNISGIKYKSKSTKDTNKEYWRIRLNADEAEKFFILIAPYIPKIMQYKLPERYRGQTPFSPIKFQNQYKRSLVEQKILEVNYIKEQHNRYDIETETHNFFANNVLVHNSSARFGYINKTFYIASRNIGLHEEKLPSIYQRIKNIISPKKESNETSIWHNVYYRENIREKLIKLAKHCRSPNVVVYGEIVGKGVQDLDYGHDVPVFYPYDIAINGKYVDPDVFKELSMLYFGKCCPILYDEIPLGEVDLIKISNGTSTLTDKHCREGVIIKSNIELHDLYIGRCILKSIGEDYYMRKNATDN